MIEVVRLALLILLLGLVLAAGAEGSTSTTPLNVSPDVSLRVGQTRTLTAAQAPSGAVIACVAAGVRLEQRVPLPSARTSNTVMGWKKGGATIQLTLRRRIRALITAACASFP